MNFDYRKIHAPNISVTEIQILSLYQALHETDVWFLHLLLRIHCTDLLATQPQIQQNIGKSKEEIPRPLQFPQKYRIAHLGANLARREIGQMRATELLDESQLHIYKIPTPNWVAVTHGRGLRALVSLPGQLGE